MAHVGVERLASGDGEDDGGENVEAGPAMMGEVVPSVMRREGPENFGIEGEVIGPEGANRDEPEDHDGSEKLADGAGALALNGEEGDEDGAAEGDDEGGGFREGDGEAFGGTEDGDGGSDDAVAVEQCGTHDGDESDDGDAAGLGGAEVFRNEGEKGKDAAFAFVISLHDEGEIFDADDQDEGPEDEGEDAVEVGLGGMGSAGGVETLFEGVEGAGANVAEDYAEGSEGERGEADFRGGMSGHPPRLSGLEEDGVRKRTS